MNPDTRDWLDVWGNAEVVWSYYDLEAARIADGGCAACEMPNFYHAPLGVESDTFYDRDMPRDHYVIGTSGLSRLSESVRECELAAKEAGRLMFHLGPKVSGASHVINKTGYDDLQVATRWSACEFVSALRRKEGFELPAAEGLLCGARPVAFDTPDYRWIYKDWAEYIEETDRQGVVDQLVELFRRGARLVTEDEIKAARAWFHWPTIISGFYERLL